MSARFLFVLAAAIVFVRLGFALVTLLTPESSKDVLAAIVQVMMVVVVFYFTRTDRTIPPAK